MRHEAAVILRQATLNDIKQLCELELMVWGEEMSASWENWESRINIFPEGVTVAVKSGRIIGVIVMNIIKWNLPRNTFMTWEQATGCGTIKNHDPDGDTLYGVDLTVVEGSPGVAKSLVLEHLKCLERMDKAKAIIGCRIPSLSEYYGPDDVISEDQLKVLTRKDPEVRFFLGCGFKIIGFKKDYFPIDKASLGWGVILSVKRT
jgi:hypothetical protein